MANHLVDGGAHTLGVAGIVERAWVSISRDA